MSEVIIITGIVALVILALANSITVEKKKKEKHKWVIRTILDENDDSCMLAAELKHNPGLCKGDEILGGLKRYVVEYSFYDIQLDVTIIMVRKKEK